MDNTPRQVLKELLATDGPALADNPQRCKGMLLDRCQAQRLEVNLLIDALEEQVPADLRQISIGTPYPILQTRLVKRLQDSKGKTEENARWAIDSWALALGVIQTEPAAPKVSSPVPPPEPKPATASFPPPPKPVVLEAASLPPTPAALNAVPPLPKPVPAQPAPQPAVISAHQVAHSQSRGEFCLGKIACLIFIAAALWLWANLDWTDYTEAARIFFIVLIGLTLIVCVRGLFVKRK